MADDHSFHFEGYRLDPQNACLWRGAQALHLTPKAFAVLHARQCYTSNAAALVRL